MRTIPILLCRVNMSVTGLESRSSRAGRESFLCPFCLADFRADGKWPDYDAFCDRFYFAVDADFPSEVLPPDTGLILADRYGGEIIRDRETATERPGLAVRHEQARTPLVGREYGGGGQKRHPRHG